jgi:hypothetical protein
MRNVEESSMINTTSLRSVLSDSHRICLRVGRNISTQDFRIPGIQMTVEMDDGYSTEFVVRGTECCESSCMIPTQDNDARNMTFLWSR